ncbi:MAG: hypothetical protein E7592_07205 [Ruminococcaceae bacterium]|nr:hypothetical protein [Oscillospiraceae bacterium]
MSLKEKKMKSLAQARQRKRDGESNVIIDMTVNNDDAFLSSFSGTDVPIISSDVADFIESSTRSLSPRECYTLCIKSNCIDEKEKVQYASAIKEYYSAKYLENSKELRANWIIALLLLLTGVLVLALAFRVEHYIWSEVIDIAAWVLLWEAVDIWALKNRALMIRRKRYLAFANMNVKYENIEKK